MRRIGRLALLLVALSACSPAPGSPSSLPPPSSAEPTQSEAERLLLAGARLDLQGKCSPLRASLPARAVAAVACKPDGELVGAVRLYAFDSERELLDAYAAWIARNGIELRSPRPCGPGRPSEGGWLPGDGGPTLIPEREACVVDPGGRSRHAVTLPPFLLAEVDGGSGDPETVGRFAWLGNQDVPGAPTLWRREGPVSPEK